MKTVLSVMVALTGVTAIQVGYVAPPATSYIYRSDNDGPASFIQLGGHGYQPQAFPAPLPLGPVKAFEAYDLAAVPLPYVAAKPIAVEDAEEDDENSEDDGDDYDDGVEGHGHEFEKGGGNKYHKGHHETDGAKGSKGYNSKEYIEKGDAGHYAKEHDEGHYGSAKGEKGAYHDEADAHGKHHKSGESYKGGDHGHKKHHSKGEEVTGYHNVFDKNEYKKDHDFYDVAEKTGHSKNFDYENKHQESYDSDHEKGSKGDSAYEKDNHGKAGYHSKGHVDDADDSHSAEEGAESEYKHEKKYGEESGKKHAKKYGYSEEEDDE